MATKQQPPKNEVATANTSSTELAEASGAIDFSEDAGKGMEGADKDSFAIPFIAILQGLSPQMETVEGAKLGLFINTVTNELYSKLRVIPCAFQRRYNRWAPRSEGGGFKGEVSVAEVEAGILNGSFAYNENDKGKQVLNPKGSKDELKDTRNHFVLIVNDDGTYAPALISLASSQIKRSKRWMALMNNLQIKNGAGKMFNPPSFSQIYEVGPAEKETNNDGSWYSFTFARVGAITDPELYAAAKAFNAQVASGKVQVSTPVDEGDAASSSGESGAF